MPLSITIVDAFSFRCGTQPFVVPVSTVEEIVEVEPAQVTRAPSGKGRAPLRMLDRRGSAIPLVSLERVFHLEAIPGELRKAIVVRRNGQPFGFEVDQMLGHQEVVVRPAGRPAGASSRASSGSTDLGDGAAHPGAGSGVAVRPAVSPADGRSDMSVLHVLFTVAGAEYALPAADVLAPGDRSPAPPRSRDRPPTWWASSRCGVAWCR